MTLCHLELLQYCFSRYRKLVRRELTVLRDASTRTIDFRMSRFAEQHEYHYCGPSNPFMAHPVTVNNDDLECAGCIRPLERGQKDTRMGGTAWVGLEFNIALVVFPNWVLERGEDDALVLCTTSRRRIAKVPSTASWRSVPLQGGTHESTVGREQFCLRHDSSCLPR